MYCDSATVAYRKLGINPATGKRYAPYQWIKYRDDESLVDAFSNPPSGSEALLLPCGKCMLCTRRYRLHWVLRCLNEMRFYSQCCYLTLTVNDESIDEVFPFRKSGFSENVDDDAFDLAKGLGMAQEPSQQFHSLRHKPFQDFMKRLRRQLEYGYHYTRIIDGQPHEAVYHGEEGKPLRYFMCGEYGDQSHRPHYHAIIFGFWPPDALPWNSNKRQYVSDMISRRWPFGFHTVSPVESGCISYVAGYVDKKMDDSRLAWADANVAPEYVCMSRGCAKIGTGGLGRQFFDKFYNDLYPLNDDGTFARDYAIVGDKTRIKVPRFYDELLDLRDPERYDKLMAHREMVAASRLVDFDLRTWLNESHRKNAVAVARRLQREPGANEQVKVSSTSVA